jgi:N-acetylglucosaminyldiphosphoundecaprenol N-acetyl-beta-D-mannosaminyltransferase
MKSESINFFEYKLYSDDLSKISINNKTIVNTINQYSFCIAEEDPKFKKSLLNSDILIPDGEGIILVSSFLFNKKLKKISGYDLHNFLLKKSNEESLRCFYLGSSENNLMKIKEKVNLNYSNITVGYYSPPFKSEFSEDDNSLMTKIINDFNPDIVFVGMTAPKQEKWVYENENLINAKLICSIGAVFDFYSGNIKRPSQKLIDLKLEWLGRLLSNPKRLWKRYLYYGPIFLGICIKRYFSAKFLRMLNYFFLKFSTNKTIL